MHFFSRRHASFAVALAAVGVLAACGDDVTVPVQVDPVLVSISPSAATLSKGGTANLSVQITGGSPTPTLQTCATGSSAVATVAVSGSSCVVTGVNPGSTTITATTTGGQAASASVTVTASEALGQLVVSPASANLTPGQTQQLTVNANPATGVTPTITYTPANPAIASVNAAGLVTAGTSAGVTTITVTATAGGGTTPFAATTRSQLVTINVVSAPQAISTLTATPSSLSLATGGTGQVAASFTQPAGAPAATLTFGTTNPAVATVAAGANNTATVTGVSAGTATITVTASAPAATGFAASTLTQLIAVTVSPSAQVSIGNITTGQTNAPVDITNVNGQIQVELNLTTNGQNVSSAQVWVCEQGEAVATCAARTNGVPAAQQTFGSAGANDGIINTFINTAEFTVATDWSNATVRHTNGQKTLVATLTVAGQAAIASNNLAILNFNNTDGFAARHVAPARSAINTTTNTTMYGGPDAAGRGSITVVPVLYTAGRSLVSVTAGLTGVCTGTVNFTTADARPWTYTYGYATTGKHVTCGAQNAPGDTPNAGPRVTASIDNAQNAGPVAAAAANFRTSTSTAPAVTTPAVIRVDYAAPSVAYSLNVQATGAEIGWVNAAYNFASSGMRSVSDAGVGAKASSTFGYAFQGCGVTTTAFSTTTGADINECSTNFLGGASFNGPYTATLTAADLLDNSASDNTEAFGVDKTLPLIRYTGGSAADTTTYTVTATSIFTGASFVAVPAAADTIFSAEALDERAGFGATAPQHFLAFANQANSTGTCVEYATGTGNNLPGAAFITAPTCGFTNGNILPALTLAAPLADGFRPIQAYIPGSVIAATEGYYSYAVRVIDRAGNIGALPVRRVLHSATAPTMTGMGIPSIVTAAGSNVFTPNFTELVESYANQFAVVYGADTLAYPAVGTYTRFDDAIGANGNTTVNTPFTSGVRFYTNIQSTLADNSIATSTPAVGDTTSVRPASVVAAVTNVGGQTATAFGVNLLDPNVQNDATAWTNATAGKGNLVDSFFVAPVAAAWNSPVNGLKARVFANTNIINSPFTRIDYYARANDTDAWQYAGTVDATVTPCLGPTAGCSVYIADNGTQRVWTYVLRQSATRPNSLTQYVLGSSAGVITTIGAGTRVMAIATSASNGRVLRTLSFTF